ncbi:cupin [Rhodothalassium salexigens]|uniref:cupin domain-containing protein n=1 Tax=Rhodothalassium salexigens TaxID=1086 RepID=UPI0019125ED9|nr:cupin domain-containing protein [Rhodothalassium salexigens]MBK5919986.1 cupin [Rhodothalassium salexigens]
MDPNAVIDALNMQPHPEGGWFAEHWREAPPQETETDPRGLGSAIYYLLERGQRSHWHRLDTTEIWHFYAGAPLRLGISPDDRTPPAWHRLGPDVVAGERPQIVVPAGRWQSAEALDGWVLVGCSLTPAFQFDGFELASPHWRPGGDRGA